MFPSAPAIDQPVATTELYPVYFPLVAHSSVARLAGVEVWPGMAVLHRQELFELRPHFVRTYARWDEIEPEPGLYEWDKEFDLDIDAIIDAGGLPYVSIKMTPAWARRHAAQPCSPPLRSAIDDWELFVYRLVKHYPDVKYWGVGNEPDLPGMYPYYGCFGEDPELYAYFLRAAYVAIHRARPDAVVIAGELAEPYGDFLGGLLDEHPPFDALAFHAYAHDVVDDVDILVQAIEHIQRELRVRGYDSMPLILSETSLLADVDTLEFRREQAEWVQAVDDIAHDYGLLGWCWYALPPTG